jgi:hypothetical protein
MRHELIERIDARFTGLRDDAETALGIAARAGEKAAAIRADRNLSEEGKMAAIRAEIAKGAIGHLNQLRQSNEAAGAALAARRANFEPKVERTLLAEQRNSELRRYLRELNHADRTRILFSGDNDVIEAVASAPAFLSGLTDDLRARAIAAHVERTHGPQIAGLAAEQSALENVAAAIAVAEMELARIAGDNLDGVA